MKKILLVSFFTIFLFGCEQEGIVEIDECIETIKLEDGDFKTYTNTFTCTYDWTEKEGIHKGAVCSKVELNENNQCSRVYFYQKDPSLNCGSNAKLDSSGKCYCNSSKFEWNKSNTGCVERTCSKNSTLEYKNGDYGCYCNEGFMQTKDASACKVDEDYMIQKRYLELYSVKPSKMEAEWINIFRNDDFKCLSKQSDREIAFRFFSYMGTFVVEDEEELLKEVYGPMLYILGCEKTDFGQIKHVFSKYPKGSFDGMIGAGIKEELGDFYIDTVFENSPAIKAGLHAGDKIVLIDGESIEGRTMKSVISLVRGEVGTELELLVERGGAEIKKSLIRKIAEDIYKESSPEVTEKERIVAKQLGITDLERFKLSIPEGTPIEEFENFIPPQGKDLASVIKEQEPQGLEKDLMEEVTVDGYLGPETELAIQKDMSLAKEYGLEKEKARNKNSQFTISDKDPLVEKFQIAFNEKYNLSSNKNVRTAMNSLKWETKNYKIEVEDLGNNNYQYFAWELPIEENSKPSLVLSNGTRIPDGSAGNYYYEFINYNYTYRCHVHVVGMEGMSPGRLSVYKDDKEIVNEDVLKDYIQLFEN